MLLCTVYIDHKLVCSICCPNLLVWYNGWFNPFKPSGVKWLHFTVFRAILV